jgi:hypothetical protein
VVANATFGLLYAVIVLDHHRRRIIHFEVTQSPTQAWLARQITEAFPWDTAPRYLPRDRDTSCGQGFRDRVRIMGIEEVITAPRSGSRHHHQRASLASRLIFLLSILSRVANSSLASQGLSGDPSNIATHRWQNPRRRATRRSPPSVSTPSRLKSVMTAPSCSLRCSCHHLVAQPPQPSALPPSIRQGVEVATVPDYVPYDG